MRKNTARLFLFAAVALAGLNAWAADPPSSGLSTLPSKSRGTQAITKPSDDRTLTFERPGKVTDMLVKVGTEVKASQLIAKQDDTEHQAALAIDKHKVEVTDGIALEAEKKVCEKDEIKLENMRKSGAAAVTELLEQESAVAVDRARVDVAKDQFIQDKLKIAQSEAAIEKLKLLSPIDGVVAQPSNPNQTILKVGEIADGSGARVVRIVKIDPLWVEAPVPRQQAVKLNPGDSAQVTFSDDHTQSGTVSVVFPVGDSASGTIIVRIEVPNPNKLQPGENVFVNFNPASGVAAKP
jgi:RND family efflux transporter MFP subunit